MQTVHNQTTARVRVGDIVTRKPATLAEPGSKNHQPARGVVKYVHPLGRFHLVEFGEAPLTVRECFTGVDRHG